MLNTTLIDVCFPRWGEIKLKVFIVKIAKLISCSDLLCDLSWILCCQMLTSVVSLMTTTRAGSHILGKAELAPSPAAHVLKLWSRSLAAAHLNP